jgi:hypothetical protein
MGRKKTTVTAIAAALALVVMATVGFVVTGCGIGIGPTQTFDIDEKLGGAAVTDVTVSMGAGDLDIGSGASGLVSGTISYNVEKWKPEIVRGDSSVAIKQGTTKGLDGVGTDVVNDWKLKLGAAPIRLAVTAGAYEGTYELGGLALQKLSIKDGAAKTHVNFASANLSQLETFSYDTGASTVTLSGLADANFKKLEFNGGAGSFTFDFSGDLRTSGSVTIDSGASKVHIIVPSGTAARVVVNGKLTDVTQEGTWTAADKTYSTPAAASSDGKLLSITVNMDVGSLTLTAE